MQLLAAGHENKFDYANVCDENMKCRVNNYPTLLPNLKEQTKMKLYEVTGKKLVLEVAAEGIHSALEVVRQDSDLGEVVKVELMGDYPHLTTSAIYSAFEKE